MKQKGQITLFVILGFILVFLISFALYAVQLSNQHKLESLAQDSIDDFVYSNAIDTYITYCLKQVTEEGLEIALKQGGYIYNYQNPKSSYSITPENEGNSYLPYTYLSRTPDDLIRIYRTNVSYGIIEYVNCFWYRGGYVNLTKESTSYYPLRKEWLENYVKRYNKFSPNGCLPLRQSNAKYSGFLGGYNYPALCSYDGLNAGNDASPCKANQYDYPSNPDALQRQLESYIESNLPTCTNFSFFENLGTNVTPNFYELNASLLFKNPTGLVVKVSYPFNVSIDGSVPFTRNVEFLTEIDGSFKQLYYYIQELLINALKDPEFNISRDWNNVTKILTYKNSFNLEIHKAVCLTEEECKYGRSMDDDIYTFTDTAHTLKNKPLTINIAVQNRRPILDYIHDYIYTTPIQGYEVDKQYYTNATLVIDPYAIDPDDDEINYTYLGWKQTYNQYLNSSCCADPDVMGTWRGGCNLSNHLSCLVKDSIETSKTLMKSDYYLSTNRSVDYKLNDTDLGYHNITLVVTDEHGARDFQIIKILVFDLPKAILNISNLFSDVSNKYASIEDITLFNTSESQASDFVGGDISKIIITDTFEPFLIVNTTHREITIPNQSFSLKNYTLGWFTKEKLQTPYQMHDVSLIVAQNGGTGMEIQSNPDVQKINVTQCLPHNYNHDKCGSSANSGDNWLKCFSFEEKDKTTWPVPFVEYGEAPNICCEPFDLSRTDNLTGGKFISATSTKPCFKKTTVVLYPFKEFGEYKILRDMISDDGSGIIINSTDTKFTDNKYYIDASPGSLAFNDIYTLTIEQKCSGKRGNVCNGDVTIVDDSVECNDLDKPYQFARCQMPSRQGSSDLVYDYKTVGNYVDTPVVCKNLTDKSFEKKFYDSITDEDYQKEFLDELQNSILNFNESLFNKGFCGIKNNFEINQHIGLTYSDNGYFSCLPKCGEGDCNYGNLKDCECNGNGAPECAKDPVKANDFSFSNPHIWNPENYVCVNNDKGKGTCDSTCGFYDWGTTKLGCYCETEGGRTIPVNPDDTSTVNQRDKIDHFFDISASRLFKLYTDKDNNPSLDPNFACCSEGVALFDRLSTNVDDSVCFDGKFYSNEIIDTGSNELLAHGQLYYCMYKNINNLVFPFVHNNLSPSNILSSGTNIQVGEFACTSNGWVKL